MENELDIAFDEAYKIASETKIKLPPDIMLELYAYYKVATRGTNFKESTSSQSELRNAFKMNAWMQSSRLSEEEAKQKYIDIVEKHLKNQ